MTRPVKNQLTGPGLGAMIPASSVRRPFMAQGEPIGEVQGGARMKTHGMRARGVRVLAMVLALALLLISSMPVGSDSAAALPAADRAQARQAPTVFDCSTVSEIPLAECQGLVALYNSTNGPG